MRIKIVAKRKYPELRRLYSSFEVGEDAELCIAVGGDGTFIRAARSFDGPILPIRSSDEWSVGYYSDVGIEDMPKIIKSLKQRSYNIERLSNKIELMYKGRRHHAVNEIVMNNAREEVSFRVYEGSGASRKRLYPYTMSGDGLLVTALVGSTAYNKSAGGPIILSPDVLCITFLNVDGPYRNPIIVDSKSVIEVEVAKYRGRLRYDGIEIGTLKPGERFRVRLSKNALKIVRLKYGRESFGDKLERIIRGRMHQ